MFDRRCVLKGLISLPWLGASSSAFSDEYWHEQVSFKSLFKPKGVEFGSSVNKNLFRNSSYYFSVIKHCNTIVPEDALKWKTLVSEETTYDFSDADRLYDFSLNNNLAMRGHALVFEKSMSDWMCSNSKDVQTALDKHIRTLCSRYPSISSWDVLNEVCDSNGINGWLRKDSLSQKMGASYISNAIKLASEFGHVNELVINEWIGPYRGTYFENKRIAVLKMLEFIKRNSQKKLVLGIQSHLLFSQEEYDADGWVSFCRECRDLDVDIKITELDLSLSDRKKFKYESKEVYEFLVNYLVDTIVNGNVNQIIVWGLLTPFSYSMRNDKWLELTYGSSVLKSHKRLDLLGRALVEVANRLPKKKN